MKKILPFFFIVSSLLLSGCVCNPGGYTNGIQVKERLQQMNESEVSLLLGAPTKTIKLSDGSKVWTYIDSSMGPTRGECKISVIIKKSKVIKADVASRDNWLLFPLGACRPILASFK